MRLPRRALLWLVTLGWGCALVYREPEIAFRGISIGGLGGNGASFEVAVEISNPNNYALGLSAMTWRLSISGVETASGALTEPVRVPGKGAATVRVPVTLEWRLLRARGLEVLASGGVDYAIEGEASFTTPVGTFHRPYRRTGILSLLPR